MKANELHTIEQSHGKPRLTAPRLSDLGTVEADGERSADHVPAGSTDRKPGTFATNNAAGRKRGAKRALRRAYTSARDRVRNALTEAAGALPDGLALPTADQIMADAFTVHMAGMRELGGESVFVQGHSLVYATETTLYGFYLEAAGQAGLLSEEGMQLHDRAQACATLAARAMTAAIAAQKVLGKRGKTARVIDAIEAEAAEGDE